MTLKTLLRLPLVLLLAFTLCLGGVGCSDDNSTTGPGDTNNPPTGDDFDEATALLVIPFATQHMAQMFTMMFLAEGGITRDYGWDEAEQAWVYPFDDAGTSGYYQIQYLNGETPQQGEAGATEILIEVDLTISTSEGSYTSDLHNTMSGSVTGMGGRATLTLEATGAVNYEFSYGGLGGGNYYANMETVAPAHVTFEEGGGCPFGELLYTMEPYSMTFELDGSAQVPYQLWDEDGNAVTTQGASGMVPIVCTPAGN